LEWLDLTGRPVTDAGLACLKSWPNLKVLWLTDTRVTDAGMRHLDDLKNLSLIGLTGTEITDAGVAVALAEHPRLQCVYLNNNMRLTDLVTRSLASLGEVRELSLDGTGITDAGLANLGGLKTLERLTFDRTAVTDAGLVHLRKLANLRTLAVEGTKVTAAGLVQLKQYCPRLGLPEPYRPPPGPPIAPAAGKAVDLLRRVETTRDAVRGTWQLQDGALVGNTRPPGEQAVLEFPDAPPEQYDLLITGQRTSGPDGIDLGIVVGGRQCLAVFDGWPYDGYRTGLQVLDGVGLEMHNKDVVRGRVLPEKKPVTIGCRVRKAGAEYRVAMLCDGREIFRWQGDAARLRPGLEPSIRPRRSDTLLLDVWRDPAVRVTKAELVPVVVEEKSPVATAQVDVFNMPGGQTSLEFVTVGDPGNAADTTGFGTVPYIYRMGKYSVTTAQYTAFLNAVAKTSDPYGLYTSDMADDTSNGCGISRSGSPGSYTYATTKNGNFPVNYVSWGDAARYCNWLQNGQPTGNEGKGTTETGAYTLNGETTNLTETRNPAATYFIPTENEWYKAAYYKGGGTNAGYWVYTARSNTAPINTLPDTGNHANFKDQFGTGNKDYSDPKNHLTAVGSFELSPGPYGTYDMGGDVAQWNESVFPEAWRGLRGGDFYSSSDYLVRTNRDKNPSNDRYSGLGFRVASVPDPQSPTR